MIAVAMKIYGVQLLLHAAQWLKIKAEWAIKIDLNS